MHILLLSTVISDERFNDLCQKGCASNPSNQHFYHSLAKMLAVKYPVDILVNRPTLKKDGRYYKNEEDSEESIHFHYLSFWNMPKLKGINIGYYSLKKLKSIVHPDTMIFVDSLNYSLLKLGFRIAKKYHLPIVGVITDHPANLTNSSKKYQKIITKLWPKFDYYYCLTPALNAKANPHNRPAFIKEGLIDVSIFSFHYQRPLDKDYLFFGGALYERYGILDLLHAFHRFQSPVHLVIAGHGPSSEIVKQYALIDNRIHYVGLLNQQEIIAFEQNALCNINPRPINSHLDDLSFPSKVLEYIASGVPLLSTKNHNLVKIFQDNVLWINGQTNDDFLSSFESLMVLSKEEQAQKAQKAKAIALSDYSLEKVAEELEVLFKDINL